MRRVLHRWCGNVAWQSEAGHATNQGRRSIQLLAKPRHAVLRALACSTCIVSMTSWVYLQPDMAKPDLPDRLWWQPWRQRSDCHFLTKTRGFSLLQTWTFYQSDTGRKWKKKFRERGVSVAILNVSIFMTICVLCECVCVECREASRGCLCWDIIHNLFVLTVLVRIVDFSYYLCGECRPKQEAKAVDVFLIAYINAENNSNATHQKHFLTQNKHQVRNSAGNWSTIQEREIETEGRCVCEREMFSDCLQGPYIRVGRTNQVLDQTSEEAKTGPRYAVHRMKSCAWRLNWRSNQRKRK